MEVLGLLRVAWTDGCDPLRKRSRQIMDTELCSPPLFELPWRVPGVEGTLDNKIDCDPSMVSSILPIATVGCVCDPFHL